MGSRGEILFKKKRDMNEENQKITSNVDFLKEKPKLNREIKLGIISEELTSTKLLPTPQPLRYIHGPDQILPSKVATTSYTCEAVKLRIEERGTANASPVSIPTMIERALTRHADKLAMSVEKNDKLTQWTYKQMYKHIRTCAKAFLKLGLDQHSGVCLIGQSSPEWAILQLATIFAGGVSMTMESIDPPAVCENTFSNCDIRIIVLENDNQLKQLLEFRNQLSTVKAIVVSNGIPKEEGVYSWSQILHLGGREADEPLDRRMKNIAINHPCIITFTSRNKNLRRGVMLSHDNITFTVLQLILYLKPLDGQEVFVAQLAGHHLLGQIADLFLPLSIGGHIHFTDQYKGKDVILNMVEKVRPTLFFALPETWDKISGKIKSLEEKISGYKRSLTHWAKSTTKQFYRSKMAGGNPSSAQMEIASQLIIKKMLKLIGLDQCRIHLTGGSAMNKSTFDHLLSVNVPVLTAYGMAECLLVTISSLNLWREDSVGRVRSGTEINVSDSGEVRVRGRAVFMGYVNEKKTTEAKIDEEGWFHTNDLGVIDQSGFLYLRGRKEADIHNTALNDWDHLEGIVETALPLSSKCLLITECDSLKLFILLEDKTVKGVSAKTEVQRIVDNWLNSMTSVNTSTTVDINENPLVKEAIDTSLNQINKQHQNLSINNWIIVDGRSYYEDLSRKQLKSILTEEFMKNTVEKK